MLKLNSAVESKLKLIGHNLCPYVQRVVILMLEKGINFERIDIDLDNKPSWLAQYSPTEKVPLLIIGDDKVLFESQVICEYLDEISAGSLQPEDSFERARHRAWGEFGVAMLSIIAQLIYRDNDSASFDKSITGLKQQLQILETEHSGFDYFAGEQFHFIDGLYATLFRYFKVLQLVTNQPILQQLPKLNAWYNTILARAAVIKAVPEEYEQLLIEFISKKHSYLSRALSNN